MIKQDKLGRTWKGKKIVWIESINCARAALYRWVKRDGERVLIYDKRRGMCDKNGYDIREAKVDTVPVLEGEDGEGTWVRFPNTEEASCFKKSITFNGYAEYNNIENMGDFDVGYDDEEIVIN